MKVAIFSRPGPCFPNVISKGLSEMLNELGVENKIFYDSVPMLMRLLPLSKKPKRWHNSLQFRIRNKISHFLGDRKTIRELRQFDAVILSECYANAFWRNYLAIDEFKKLYRGTVISYTESPLDSAPVNRINNLDADDYNESIYDFNLFVTDKMEVKAGLNSNQVVVGVNIDDKKILRPTKKTEFIAVLDFAKTGFESYRRQAIQSLEKLGVKYILLEGNYPIEEIRKIYARASVFFLSFPETFGLPIAECLSCGTYIFTPDSSWPMSWRLDSHPESLGPGKLPDCFQVYSDSADLENKLSSLMKNYDPIQTPKTVFDTFLHNYRKFYEGDLNALKVILEQAN